MNEYLISRANDEHFDLLCFFFQKLDSIRQFFKKFVHILLPWTNFLDKESIDCWDYSGL